MDVLHVRPFWWLIDGAPLRRYAATAPKWSSPPFVPPHPGLSRPLYHSSTTGLVGVGAGGPVAVAQQRDHQWIDEGPKPFWKSLVGSSQGPTYGGTYIGTRATLEARHPDTLTL